MGMNAPISGSVRGEKVHVTALHRGLPKGHYMQREHLLRQMGHTEEFAFCVEAGPLLPGGSPSATGARGESGGRLG